MKEFVITGLTTPELKAEAETILKRAGYNHWGGIWKNQPNVYAKKDGSYTFTSWKPKDSLTLTEAREMLKS